MLICRCIQQGLEPVHRIHMHTLGTEPALTGDAVRPCGCKLSCCQKPKRRQGVAGVEFQAAAIRLGGQGTRYRVSRRPEVLAKLVLHVGLYSKYAQRGAAGVGGGRRGCFEEGGGGLFAPAELPQGRSGWWSSVRDGIPRWGWGTYLVRHFSGGEPLAVVCIASL